MQSHFHNPKQGCIEVKFYRPSPWNLFSFKLSCRILAHIEALSYGIVLYMSGNINQAPIPLPVSRALKKFGMDLSLSRRRRCFSQQSMAERIGISVSSLRRLEKGDPSLSWGTIARALYVLGKLDKLNELIDTANDSIGLVLMDEQLPRRIRKRKISSETGAL